MSRLRILWVRLFVKVAVSTAVCACARPSDAPKRSDTDQETRSVSCDRIVSFAPSITETLFALGLGDKVAGVTKYCKYPDAAKQKPSVGGYMDPDMEALVTLSPSVVMLLSEHDSVEKNLSELGIPFLRLRHTGTAEIEASIRRIGRACAVDEAADRLWAGISARIARVTAETRNLPKVRTLITMGRNMGSGGIGDVFIAGRKTFYNDLIRMAGGVNVYDGDVPIPMVSQEGIIAMNPEVIVDMVPETNRRGGVSAEAVAADWRDVPVDAVRFDRVFVFEEPYAVIPGPRFVDTLEHLARVMHREKSLP